MVSSWPTFVSQCKSRLSAIARSCFLGRALWREKFKEVSELIEELRKEIEAAEAYGQQLEQENTQLRERVSELEAPACSATAGEVATGRGSSGTTVRDWHDCVVRESGP